MTHCARSEEAIAGDQSHIVNYEVAGAAGVAGVQLRTVKNDPRGRLDPAEVEATVRGENVHLPRTALVCLENTHNRCGGAAIPLEDIAAVADVAHRHGARVHMDGARIFNAAIALETSVAALSEPVDSVGFCLSKGLGAPVGSVLCGSAEFIARARKNRKMVGGGMRQAGVIAAAGVYALQNMVDRLADDHANAKLLARGLAELPMVDLDPMTVDTNLVIFDVRGDWLGFSRAVKAAGVLHSVTGPGRLRMVTHYGIERSDIEGALERIRSAVAATV
jgi:threonine aldolase